MPDLCDPTPLDPLDPVAVLARAIDEPQSVTIDGNTATAHPLDQTIKATRYVESVKAAKAGRVGWAGLVKARVVLPGAV